MEQETFNLIPAAAREHLPLHISISVMLWLIVFAAILIDLWDALYTARVTGQRIRSHKLRTTAAKIGEYWRLMMIAFLVDTVGLVLPFYALPYLSMVLCVGLVCTEAKSMLEHAQRRQSKAAELKDIVRMVMDCASEADARAALKKFGDYLDSGNSNETDSDTPERDR